MSEEQQVFHQNLNPDYGKGLFRRRIRLCGSEGKVLAELEDGNHGFRSIVSHDGKNVTDIQAQALRIPLNTCGGATEPIKALIGLTLGSSASEIIQVANPRANCTHLYDLTVLAIHHCQRGEITWQYDMEVEDEVADVPVQSRVYLNDQLVFSWRAIDWTISEGPFAGKPLYKGFSAWASEALEGVRREAAFALQKAYFVSQARRYNMDSLAGTPAREQTTMLGVCYSYTPPIIDQAVRSANNTRDFTDTPEQLLQFL